MAAPENVNETAIIITHYHVMTITTTNPADVIIPNVTTTGVVVVVLKEENGGEAVMILDTVLRMNMTSIIIVDNHKDATVDHVLLDDLLRISHHPRLRSTLLHPNRRHPCFQKVDGSHHHSNLQISLQTYQQLSFPHRSSKENTLLLPTTKGNRELLMMTIVRPE